ncbi:TRAP transporter small permease [Cucumibacter marinus]|uniref:TRAP transporter small permease n=1 Tax=Cucumibacter marinus TaxID=1121252 RepID=UPI00040E65BD|nr:TRAP transporter small permease [Cucumibacter marinus]
MTPASANDHDASPLRAAVRRFARWVNRLTEALALLGITALVGAIVVVVLDIVLRRLGGRSFIGTVDLTQLCLVAAASWSIPYAFSRGAHVTVDLISGWLPRGMPQVLDAIALVTGAALLAFLFYLSWGRAMEQLAYGDVSQDLAIPMIWYWVFLLSGLAVSVLAALTVAFEHATGLRHEP